MENEAVTDCRITFEKRRPDGNWEATTVDMVYAVAPRLLPRGPNAPALGGALGGNYGPEAGGALWGEIQKLWDDGS